MRRYGTGAGVCPDLVLLHPLCTGGIGAVRVWCTGAQRDTKTLLAYDMVAIENVKD